MAVRQPRYSKEEFTQRGNALYESKIRLQVEPAYLNKIVAIDIETSDFEIGDDSLSAADLLFQRLPNAQPWCVRVGTGPVHCLRFNSPREAP
jgi:peptide subunit release factor RF-3